jgi:hypothetical protein
MVVAAHDVETNSRNYTELFKSARDRLTDVLSDPLCPPASDSVFWPIDRGTVSGVAEQFLFGEAVAECPYSMVLLKFGIRKLFPEDFAPKDLQGVSLRHGVELFDLEALQKGFVAHEQKAGFGQGHRCMLASAGLPVPLRGGPHRDFLPLAAGVRWFERGEWKSDGVTWSNLYHSTSRGKKFARALRSFR